MKKLILLSIGILFALYSNAAIVYTFSSGTITGVTGITSLTALAIPDNVGGVAVTAISASAFANQTFISSLFIPNTVTSIGASAFSGCTGITSVTLGSGLTAIGNSAFNGCTALKNIYAYPSTPVDLSSSTLAFSGVTGCTLYVTAASSAAYTAATVWSGFIISSASTFNFGVGAYSGFVTGYTGLVPATLSIPALNGTTPVTAINSSAFLNQTGITSVTIPGSVTSIGANSFQNCYGITSLTIPNSVTTILQSAFANCTNLASLSFSAPTVITNISDYAFQGNKLTSVSIPNSVTYLGVNQFNGCSLLTSITLGNSIQTIGASCFVGTKITSLVIPNSVTSIGATICQNVTTLTSLNLGSGLTTFGAGTFYGCTGLTSIYANMITPVDLTSLTTTFTSVPFSSCILYVPAASLAKYKAANVWKNFTNTQGILNAALSTVKLTSISLYPNPTQDFVSIKGLESAGTLTITDLNGRLMMTKHLAGDETVSVRSLAQGMYFVKITCNEGVAEQKLMKK